MPTFKKAFGLFLFTLTALQLNAQSFYRSKASGNWNSVTTWESAPAAIGPWVAAIATPTSADYTVTVQNPHIVTMIAAVTIDEVVINLGGTLAATGGFILTINNGPGTDLINNGTFSDNLVGTSVAFSVGATWSVTSGANFIKTTSSSSNLWQQNYQGGISTIPSNANWILRRQSASLPALSSVAGIGGAFYPNLIIENYYGFTPLWTTAVASSFTGTTAFPTVKGYLDIGGSGTFFVDFLNGQTFSSPTLVIGNVTVRTGSNIRNYGTGLEIQGNLTTNGSINYDANDARKIIFSGGNAQTISGTGTIGIYYMKLGKTANDLTLNRAITVDNQLDLTQGRIFSSATNLITLIDVATVVNTNNVSFVHGPIRKNGNNAFVFPVGKNNDYQAIGMSSGGGGGTVTFWNETFGTGCNQGFFASAYNGPNGLWTQTLTGANQPEANVWYVSATEAGMGTGNCGNGCISNAGLTNRTLHVGANDGFTSSDPGAAYNAGGLCGVLFCVTTDKRIESPVINCTGRANINISFNYIENGQGTNDNAVLWFYDGTTWSNIYDMPKTPTCSGQGLWTYTTITLPPSADNNPNVKIAFRWVNNDDGAGTDPSFAVDDIQLSVSSSDIYTAEYFRGNPKILFGPSMDPSLISVSSCEYWQLDRNSGTSNRIVSLDWDGNSCGITNMGNLRVARWEIPGAIWRDEGNGGVTGGLPAGTIQSGNFISTYGTFTLSAIDPQPLPIELLTFTAQYNGHSVDINWTTASEVNNDYFTVERSTDASEFLPVGYKKSLVNSSYPVNYMHEDKEPLKGISYYRLRQTDKDGRTSVSKPRQVNISNTSAFAVYANAASEQLIIHGGMLSKIAKIELLDGIGKVLFVNTISGSAPHIIQTTGLARGVYFARLSDENGVSVARFVY